MSENSRQQRMIERVQEDERLRGDLAGENAQQLVDWATAKVRAFAADANQSDDEVEAQVQAVRFAARHAAQAGVHEPHRIIALAEETLAARSRAKPAYQDEQPASVASVTQPKSWFVRTWRRCKNWFANVIGDS